MIYRMANILPAKIRFKTPTLRLDLGHYSDVHVIVKRTINLKINENNDMPRKDTVVENNTKFMSRVTKINNILIGNEKIIS